jgi:uncharacterized protein GlcG (DUF336 family)
LLPGAVPLFKKSLDPGQNTVTTRLVGGVGVYGVPADAAEFAALMGAQGFAANVPPQGAVVLGGIRLPYVAQTTRPDGFGPGTFGQGRFVVEPRNGSRDPFGYLIGPRGSPRGNFSEPAVERVVDQCVAKSDQTRAAIRLPSGSSTAVIIVITDLDGLVLAHFRMEDTLTDAVDVVPAKARSVVYYSRPEGPDPADAIPGIPVGTAITTTTLGFLSQPFFPPGIDGNEEGPLFQLALLNRRPEQATRLGHSPASPGLQNGIIFFPGAVPLYDGAGNLIGGLGVSGDGVENNDLIAAAGAVGFEPPPAIRADNFFFRGERLPYLKFSRNPNR